MVVGASAEAGRGMYAAEEIEAGELIQDAAPIVAHPTLKNLDKVSGNYSALASMSYMYLVWLLAMRRGDCICRNS